MSLMWMPAHTTVPPLRTCLSAVGTSAPTDAKMIAASNACGGASLDPSRPHAAERAREILALGIAVAREGEHLATLPCGDLGEDVS